MERERERIMKVYEIFDEVYEVLEDSANMYETETISDLVWMAGKQIVRDNGLEYYEDMSEYDAINQEASDIIHLWAIDRRSTLFDMLYKWYGSYDLLEEHVRNMFWSGCNMYFVTGCNYAIFDKDLLGGNGDGTTKDKFLEFVEKELSNE